MWGLFAAFVSLIVVAVGLFLYLSSGVDRAKSATNLSPTVMGTLAPPALPAPVPDLVVPNEVARKAPAVSLGVDTAVICGPFETGRVLRARFPVGFKLMPHFHPDEWRTAGSLLRQLLFRSSARVRQPASQWAGSCALR